MEPGARAVLDDVLAALPPVRFACAYGSAAREQPGGGGGGLDLLLAVDEPAHWHSANIARHRSHYGPIASFGGGRAVAGLASRVGPGVHFNSMVPFHDFLLKYGVIRTSDLLDDLRSWCRMYTAGRLQKPVEELVSDRSVSQARHRNLRMAFAAALLQLPQQFTRQELRQMLVSLSYAGDIRMAVGAEDRSKVQRIAGGSADELDRLYAPVAASFGLPYELRLPQGDTLAQDTGEDASERLLLELPHPVLARIARDLGMRQRENAFVRKGTFHSLADVASEAAAQNTGTLVARAIGRIVWRSSARQFAASMLATGPVRSMRYVGSKAGRALKARAAAFPAPSANRGTTGNGSGAAADDGGENKTSGGPPLGG